MRVGSTVLVPRAKLNRRYDSSVSAAMRALFASRGQELQERIVKYVCQMRTQVIRRLQEPLKRFLVAHVHLVDVQAFVRRPLRERWVLRHLRTHRTKSKLQN